MGEKLLIVTQIVNKDSRFSFFLEWIKEFSKNYNKILVICLEKGEYKFPKNVEVYSLGKEENKNKIIQIFNFLKLIWMLNYDKIFVHMNPIWVIIGKPLFFLKGTKVYMWFTHRAISLKLRLAKLFASKIFTASKESFSLLHDKKVKIVGHGINTEIFKPMKVKKRHQIISVGRITKIKNYETIIKSLKYIDKKISLIIVGLPVTQKDKEYFKKIKKMIKNQNLLKRVVFLGNVSQKRLAKLYSESQFSVNGCPTGGMDKVVLESILCGTIPFVSNKTFKNLYGNYFENFYFEHGNYNKLANLINKDRKTNKKKIIYKVRKDYSLKELIKRLEKEMI